jgi:VanZ family protein
MLASYNYFSITYFFTLIEDVWKYHPLGTIIAATLLRHAVIILHLLFLCSLYQVLQK